MRVRHPRSGYEIGGTAEETQNAKPVAHETEMQSNFWLKKIYDESTTTFKQSREGQVREVGPLKIPDVQAMI